MSSGSRRAGPGNRQGNTETREAVVAAARCAGYKRAVRLICFGDIHMAFRAIERLGPILREADHAILTGHLPHLGDPPAAFRVVDAVRQFCPSVLAVTGNLDMPWVIDAFRADGISLHGEGRRFGDPGIFGWGGLAKSPPGHTPGSPG